MRSEYDAMQGLASSSAQAKQEYVASRNIVTNFEESERKKRVNEAFWRGVMRFITQMTVVLIAAYMFFNFI